MLQLWIVINQKDLCHIQRSLGICFSSVQQRWVCGTWVLDHKWRNAVAMKGHCVTYVPEEPIAIDTGHVDNKRHFLSWRAVGLIEKETIISKWWIDIQKVWVSQRHLQEVGTETGAARTSSVWHWHLRLRRALLLGNLFGAPAFCSQFSLGLSLLFYLLSLHLFPTTLQLAAYFSNESRRMAVLCQSWGPASRVPGERWLFNRVRCPLPLCEMCGISAGNNGSVHRAVNCRICHGSWGML